jgi:hypothetical protein
VSIKDQGIGTCEQVLNEPITCRWYGPCKPSSMPSTGAWLKRTTSMAVLGEKLRRVLWTTQLGWEVELGAVFLGSSASVQPCWWLCERLLCVDRVRYIWSETIRRLSVECVWRVGQIFLYRVYINSNRRDSWIWVTACTWLPSSSNLLDSWLILINGIALL